jgi:hypothetical protein
MSSLRACSNRKVDRMQAIAGSVFSEINFKHITKIRHLQWTRSFHAYFHYQMQMGGANCRTPTIFGCLRLRAERK